MCKMIGPIEGVDEHRGKMQAGGKGVRDHDLAGLSSWEKGQVLMIGLCI